ncbi:MAG: NADH-quinone oxidoreductase subunit J [Pseudomonadales bacterium]|nr:NADH-quinone oxidoreductase subunit J [Pseudomonadales bacterium]
MMLLATFSWHEFFFMLFAILACGFAVGVLLSTNIVRMAFYLVISLGSTAGLFFLAGAEFVGAMQLMIYVGGTLVLLIFGVMLTAQQRFISLKSYGRDWVLGLAVGGSLLLLLLNAAFGVADWYTPRPKTSLAVDQSKTATPLGLALAGVRADKLETRHQDEEKDKRLKGGMSGYLLPFVIVSVHLLVVLIGAAYMARTKRVAPKAEPASEGKPD